VDLAETRFADRVGQHCPSSRCTTLVVWASTSSRDGRLLVDAQPDDAGDLLLRDVGGESPLVLKLTTAQQFGRQGQLHRSHLTHCELGKRENRRRKKHGK
jgi:hypothetical protein